MNRKLHALFPLGEGFNKKKNLPASGTASNSVLPVGEASGIGEPTSPGKSGMSKWLRVAVSAILLSWIAWHTDWSRVGAAFARLQVELWLAAVGVLIVTQVVSAWRWRLMARRLRFDRGLRQLTSFYFIGMYFNLLLPTSVGGDVVRAWYLDGRSGRRLAAFASVFLDRLSGLMVLLAVACLAVALSPLALPAWMAWSVWSTGAGFVLGLAALPWVARYLGPLRRQQVLELLATFRRPKLFAATTALSALVQAANVVLVMLVGRALHVDIPLSYYWVFVPMVSLLTLLPISVNGMGVREGGTALLLAPLGIGHDVALSLALLWFAVFAAASLVGGAVYLFGRPAHGWQTVGAPSEENDHGFIHRDSDQGRARQYRIAA